MKQEMFSFTKFQLEIDLDFTMQSCIPYGYMDNITYSP